MACKYYTKIGNRVYLDFEAVKELFERNKGRYEYEIDLLSNVASEVGLSLSTLNKKVKKRGINLKDYVTQGNDINVEEAKRMAEEYRNNFSSKSLLLSFIAGRIGATNRSALSRKLKESGIDLGDYVTKNNKRHKENQGLRS